MSDETASDVQEVVPQTQTIRLSGGLALTLSEPTYPDFADGEKLLGRQPGQWIVAEADAMGFSDRMRHYAALLWILCRRTGRTDEQRKAGAWPVTLEQILEQWTFSDFRDNVPVIVRFFVSCLGLELEPVSPGASVQGSATPTA